MEFEPFLITDKIISKDSKVSKSRNAYFRKRFADPLEILIRIPYTCTCTLFNLIHLDDYVRS